MRGQGVVAVVLAVLLAGCSVLAHVRDRPSAEPPECRETGLAFVADLLGAMTFGLAASFANGAAAGLNDYESCDEIPSGREAKSWCFGGARNTALLVGAAAYGGAAVYGIIKGKKCSEAKRAYRLRASLHR